MGILETYSHHDHKYSGIHDANFETKFALFCERCNQAVIPHGKRYLAFFAMLTRSALKFDLTHSEGDGGTRHGMAAKIKEHFIAHESVLALSRERESMSLQKFRLEHENQPISSSLNQMITRLQDIQLCLPRVFQSDDLLYNRLLNACAEIEACRHTWQKVAPTLMGVVADLQTSISTFLENNDPNGIAEMHSNALITDKRPHQGSDVPTWREKKDNKS